MVKIWGEKKKKASIPFYDLCSNELDSGGSPNVYLGQWDAIKEKMVWGVMEREKAMIGGLLNMVQDMSVDHVEVGSSGRTTSKPNSMHVLAERKKTI